jgi:hypothetical protein
MEGPLLGGKFWRVPSIVETGKGVCEGEVQVEDKAVQSNYSHVPQQSLVYSIYSTSFPT